MDGRIYYLTALLLWSGLAIRIPRLLQSRRDPALVSLCAVVLAAGVSFTLSAPASVAAVNHLTGIPNIAAPLVYTVVTAFSAACLVVIVHWRGGEPGHVRRVARRWMTAYALVIVALWVLFAVGNAPVERRTDLDTYYATTPGLAEMITLYLVAHLIAAFTTTTLCWRWSRKVTGWTRWGLSVLVLGWLLNGAFGVVKLAAVAGRWTGRHWDSLSTDLAPGVAAVAAALVTVGYALPLVAPRIESVTAYARLRPLFELLVDPADKRYWVPLSWRSLGDIDLRLTQRETGIRDGITRLEPRFDTRVRERAYRRAISAGASAPEAEAIAAAAMVVAASQPGTPDDPPPGGHVPTALDGTPDDPSPGGYVPTALDGTLGDLVRVSQAVHTLIATDTPRDGGRPESRRT
ncbi:MAB_1171c family putative transporter [Streptomyces sp. NPDC093261]|uniref:MAB_1171c family putative transporter n=1 Tax=Streptomyces sp. NPDC093261 TaxID=3366037 RepID=UPI00381D73DC